MHSLFVGRSCSHGSADRSGTGRVQIRRCAVAYTMERLIHHIDNVIMAKRDLDTTWTAAADNTAESRYYYLPNWRNDTCAITNAYGIVVRNYRFTAHGTRTEVAVREAAMRSEWRG